MPLKYTTPKKLTQLSKIGKALAVAALVEIRHRLDQIGRLLDAKDLYGIITPLVEKANELWPALNEFVCEVFYHLGPFIPPYVVEIFFAVIGLLPFW